MGAIQEKLLADVPKLELNIIAEEWAKELKVNPAIIREALVEFISKKRLQQGDDMSAAHRVSFDAYVTKEDIVDFCNKAEWTLPKFWFPPERKKPIQSYGKAEADCRKWLELLVAAGDKPASKSNILELAKKEFHGLSEEAFNRVWNDIVPPSWKTAGRFTKNRK